jgi:hypothetical protein
METWLSDLAHTDLDAYMKLIYAPEDGAYRVDYSYYGNTAGPYAGSLRTNYQHFEKGDLFPWLFGVATITRIVKMR